jgi:hypothetical protein
MSVVNYKTALFASALMAVGVIDAAWAQLSPAFDPAQLPGFKGKVVQYIPTPRGDVDGLLLADGTEVQVGPGASTQLVFAIKPGDSVTIHGVKARALPLIDAASVTNDATGVTVLGGQGRWHEHTMVTVEGHVKAALHDPRGETNGVLLDDGTIVRMPPPEAKKFADSLAVGKDIVVRGEGYAGPLGKAIGARDIGPDAAHLTHISGPGHGWGMWMHEHMMGHGPMHGHDGAPPPAGGPGAPPPPPPQ